MSDEVKLKINVPMFEVGELEMFDNNIHNIIEEYSKMMFKEKDQILTQRIIMKQEEEIERLNNIIKRLEDFIEKEIELYTIELTKENERKLSIVAPIKGVYKEIYNVLQELKGDGSNE